MRKRLARLLLILCICLGVALLLLTFLLNRREVYQSAIPPLVHRGTDAVQIKSIQIPSAVFRFPDEWQWEDAAVVLRVGEEDYALSVGRLLVKADWWQRQARVFGSGIRVENSAMGVERIDVAGTLSARDRKRRFEGILRMDSARYGKAQIRPVRARLSADADILEITDISAGAYGGRLTGQILLEYKENIPYSITLDFSGVELERLKPLHREVFSAVRGRVNGRMKLAGSRERVKTVEADFKAPGGGRIKAQLLKVLFDMMRLPEGTTQGRELTRLAQNDSLVPLQRADIRLTGVSDRQLTAQTRFYTKELNLDVDVTTEVNIEGGLFHLLSMVLSAIKTD